MGFFGHNHAAGTVTGRGKYPLLCRVLLLLATLAQVQAVAAQQGEPISPSVVLVLKLVSSTLVKPTTGIVISADGMVLVPAGFATEAGEMIVLDGGADISSNGRPAKLVAGAGADGLAVLSVKGLKRPGIKLAANSMNTNGALHLEAFPPAEQIARGAQPLRLPVKLIGAGPNSSFTISPQTPLPYVTGAILDDCGYLAGLSLTDAPQSLDSGETPQVLLNDELGRLFTGMQISLPSAICERPVAATVTPVVTKAASDLPDAAAAAKQAPVVVNTPGENAAAGVTATNTGQPPASPVQQAAVAPQVPATVASAPEPSGFWRRAPAWLVLLSIIALGVLAWKGAFIFRLSSAPGIAAHLAAPVVAVQPASAEPETAPLDDATANQALKPRSAPVIDFDLPATATMPENCNGLLLIEGMLDADTPFKRFCFVDTGRINAVIGRGDADIAIEHAAISRAHARIQSDGEYLTLSDLGSRNGSFIGDVPCLPGEILFLRGDDEVFLGDVKMTIRVVTETAEWA